MSEKELREMQEVTSWDRGLCVGFYTMNSQGCVILTGLVPEGLMIRKLSGEQIKF